MIVDTGFNSNEAVVLNHKLQRLPRGAPLIIEVQDIIVTNMHHGHADTLNDFRAARFPP